MFLSETLLGRELHTSQTADSILNHVLKNTLADVPEAWPIVMVGNASTKYPGDGSGV